MSPALTRSSAIWCFEGSDAFEVCEEITFNFYTGLPHLHLCLNQLKSVEINPPELCNWLRMKDNYNKPLHSYLLQNFNFQIPFFSFFFLPKHSE